MNQIDSTARGKHKRLRTTVEKKQRGYVEKKHRGYDDRRVSVVCVVLVGNERTDRDRCKLYFLSYIYPIHPGVHLE